MNSPPAASREAGPAGRARTPLIEAYLALLYTDRAACEAFLADPAAAARAAGLGPEEAAAMEAIDPRALRLAARGFARKRAARRPVSWWRRLLGVR